MSPVVESNGNAAQVGAHDFDRFKNPETFYPFTHSFVTGMPGGAEDIYPYTSRMDSPVRVTNYSTSPTMMMKRKSKVDEVSRSTAFNLRPLKRGDKVTPWNHRFRSPDATLPTLTYIPPWVSITKSDYGDPRFCNGSEGSSRSGHHQLYRSHTDLGLETPLTPAISVKTPRLLASRSDSRATGKTALTEKRVTILAPVQNGEVEIDIEMAENVDRQSPDVTSTGSRQISPFRATAASPRSKVKHIQLPDTGVNYYSGYLPPEFSEKIAEQLAIKNMVDIDELGKRSFVKDHHKPLVGDRTWFMKDPYPTQPKLYQSDIDQIRFEGHKKLVQSNGQATNHFSVLKRNGPSIRPAQNGARLEEAWRAQKRLPNGPLIRPAQNGARLEETLRTQQRLAQSAAPDSRRMPQVTTSIDSFERQREKTYHLQSLAKEMLK